MTQPASWPLRNAEMVDDGPRYRSYRHVWIPQVESIIPGGGITISIQDNSL